MFLLKQSTLSAVIFPFVPLVLSLLCVYYIRILLSRNVCLVPNEVVSNECDDVLDNVAPRIERKCGESALCIQQNDVAKEIKYAKEFRSRYAMFVNHCNINNGDYHVRRRFDLEPSRIPVKNLEKFSRKNKQIKKLVCRRMLKKFLSRKKCIATSNADLEQGAIMTVSSLYKRWECFAVGLYAICYSVAKSCSYWNSRTLHCIADQGNKLYHNMGINRCLKMADLYTSLYICGVEISVQLKAQSYGMLSTSLKNTKNKLENLIFNKYSGNTGFPLRNGFWNSLEFLGFS